MSEHFNKLTPAQAERLAMLAEECGEVIQVVGKILRHGYENFHPENPNQSNRELLGRELTDLLAVAASLCRDNVPEGSLFDQDRAEGREGAPCLGAGKPMHLLRLMAGRPRVSLGRGVGNFWRRLA